MMWRVVRVFTSIKTQRFAVPAQPDQAHCGFVGCGNCEQSSRIAMLAQVKVCGFFAAPSGVQMLRTGIFARQEPREGIEKREV